MKKLICFLLLASCLTTGFAQVTQEPVIEGSENFKGKMPEFRGGAEAWRRYLERNLQYPQDALDKGTQGEVKVQFIVLSDGKLKDIKAIEGPEELRKEAVRMFKLGPTWTPAELNGEKVAYRHVHSITFRLE